MNITESLIRFLKKGHSANPEPVPEGLCPNCWGREKYGEQFFEAVKRNNTDINAKNPNVGWIQDYADRHLSGIVLHQKDDTLVCNNCKIAYRTAT